MEFYFPLFSYSVRDVMSRDMHHRFHWLVDMMHGNDFKDSLYNFLINWMAL